MIKCNKCSVLLKDEWFKLHDEVNCDEELFSSVGISNNSTRYVLGKHEPPSKSNERKSFAQTSTRRNKKPIGFFDFKKIMPLKPAKEENKTGRISR